MLNSWLIRCGTTRGLKMRNIVMAAVSVAALSAIAAPAQAAITVDYYRVTPNGQDFGKSNPTISTINNGVQNNLGPNGRPVITSSNPLGATSVNSSNELMWWTPNGASNLTVSYEGRGTIAGNSFADTSFFSPMGAGTGNGTAFQTAIFSGSFNLNAARSVDFTIAADDDAFLFIDGVSKVQIGGIHPADSQTYSVALGAGSHTFQLFYADRLQSNAQLSFALPNDLTVTAPVPEPATWAMMLVGFGMVGAVARRRRSATKVTYA